MWMGKVSINNYIHRSLCHKAVVLLKSIDQN